jgi:cobalt/nickel transport system permease protein
MIPDWLTKENAPQSSRLPAAAGTPGPPERSDTGAAPAGRKGSVLSAGKKSFVERTIDSTARFFQEAILTEAFAGRAGLLQALDPRVKLCTVLALIVSVSVMKSPAAIWGVYACTLLLAGVSRIPLGFFLKRVWLFVPLFSAVIVVPALFNLVTPGEPLWTALRLSRSYDFGPYHVPETIAITRQGVLTAATFIGRVAASVSLAVLLTLTTRWNTLLRALEALRVPATFILILAMAYRYIALLVTSVQEIHIARKSRTIRYGTTREEQGWVASRIGYLFKKTYALSLEVHKAMLSRGFSGEIRTLASFETRNCDYAWVLFVTFFCALVLFIDRSA